uniref:Uncharacterized protein n=1 Tax=Sphaerodactylus townsendi TaxID=933632 RepID=A0ACB8ER66_9SAUR
MKSVPVADLGRTVQEFAHVPIMELVIQLIGLVNVTLAGLVVTVHSIRILLLLFMDNLMWDNKKKGQQNEEERSVKAYL